MISHPAADRHGPRPAGRLHINLATLEALWGYFFIAPWLLGLVVFTAGPIVTMVYNSFTRYDILSPPKWLGLANYVTILTRDPLFWKSLWNTCYYVGLSVPLHLGLGFAAALLVNQRLAGMQLFRVALYLPSMTPFVAMAAVWMVTFSRTGLLNYFLGVLGIPQQGWLVSEAQVKPAIVMISLWYIGSPMVVFLAGLRSIPEALYEAAAMDGAGAWARLRHIVLPMMTPSILFNLILGIIGSFQVFAHGYILTGGGPRNASLFYVHYIYRHAFEALDMGYASALTVVLLVIVLVLTVLLFRTSETWVHYERV